MSKERIEALEKAIEKGLKELRFIAPFGEYVKMLNKNGIKILFAYTTAPNEYRIAEFEEAINNLIKAGRLKVHVLSILDKQFCIGW